MPTSNEMKFNVQRLYVQETRFKIENPPEIFKQLSHAKPEQKLELKVETKTLGEVNMHEVVLQLNLSLTIESRTIYNAFVRQAGIFTLEGYIGDDLDNLLNAYCAELLYPYARQVLSEQLVQGSFPNLVLMPINFTELHRQRKAQQANHEKTSQVQRIDEAVH